MAQLVPGGSGINLVGVKLRLYSIHCHVINRHDYRLAEETFYWGRLVGLLGKACGGGEASLAPSLYINPWRLTKQRGVDYWGGVWGAAFVCPVDLTSSKIGPQVHSG